MGTAGLGWIINEHTYWHWERHLKSGLSAREWRDVIIENGNLHGEHEDHKISGFFHGYHLDGAIIFVDRMCSLVKSRELCHTPIARYGFFEHPKAEIEIVNGKPVVTLPGGLEGEILYDLDLLPDFAQDRVKINWNKISYKLIEPYIDKIKKVKNIENTKKELGINWDE